MLAVLVRGREGEAADERHRDEQRERERVVRGRLGRRKVVGSGEPPSPQWNVMLSPRQSHLVDEPKEAKTPFTFVLSLLSFGGYLDVSLRDP